MAHEMRNETIRTFKDTEVFVIVLVCWTMMNLGDQTSTKTQNGKICWLK